MRVVPVNLVLDVVSIGHAASTPAPGEKQAALMSADPALTRGDPNDPVDDSM